MLIKPEAPVRIEGCRKRCIQQHKKIHKTNSAHVKIHRKYKNLVQVKQIGDKVEMDDESL